MIENGPFGLTVKVGGTQGRNRQQAQMLAGGGGSRQGLGLFLEGTLVTSTLPGIERLIGNLLVRIHFIIVMIRWTGLAPWEFEFPFSGSLTSTFLKR